MVTPSCQLHRRGSNLAFTMRVAKARCHALVVNERGEEGWMEELRRVQRDYGAAFANLLTLAKQRGLDCPTVERLLHALILDGQPVPNDVDHLQVALRRAALAFRLVIDAVHKAGVTAIA